MTVYILFNGLTVTQLCNRWLPERERSLTIFPALFFALVSCSFLKGGWQLLLSSTDKNTQVHRWNRMWSKVCCWWLVIVKLDHFVRTNCWLTHYCWWNLPRWCVACKLDGIGACENNQELFIFSWLLIHDTQNAFWIDIFIENAQEYLFSKILYYNVSQINNLRELCVVLNSMYYRAHTLDSHDTCISSSWWNSPSGCNETPAGLQVSC